MNELEYVLATVYIEPLAQQLTEVIFSEEAIFNATNVALLERDEDVTE